MSRKTKRLAAAQRAALAAPPAMQATTTTGGPYFLTGSGWQAAGNSPNRGMLYWPSTDQRRQMTSVPRNEMLRKQQWLLAHFGFANRLVQGMARMLGYIIPQPNTTDEEWNDLAHAALMDIMGSANTFDASGKFDGINGQVQDNEMIFGQGDGLAVMTETTTGRARLQYYGAHQIKNGPKTSGPGWSDGVLLSRSGAHLAYSVQDGENPDLFTVIEAKDAIYLGYWQNRPQVRALSVLHPAILNMVDVVEINGMVKAAIKNTARVGLAIESEMPTQTWSTGGAGLSQGTGSPTTEVTATLPDGTTQKLNFETATGGSLIQNLAPGQHVKVISDNRPSPEVQAFKRDLLNDCCMAQDLSFNALCDIAGITGPGVRYLNAEMKRWIALRRHPQVRRTHRIAVWVLAKEMKRGALRAPRLASGEQWWNCLEYYGMANMDIDGGRTSAATETDLLTGLTTFLEQWGQKGAFWKRMLRQGINEHAFLVRECLKVATATGIDPSLITPQIVFPKRYNVNGIIPGLTDTQINNRPLPDPGDEPEPT